MTRQWLYGSVNPNTVVLGVQTCGRRWQPATLLLAIFLRRGTSLPPQIGLGLWLNRQLFQYTLVNESALTATRHVRMRLGHGLLFLVRREVIDQVGLFDPRFFFTTRKSTTAGAFARRLERCLLRRNTALCISAVKVRGLLGRLSSDRQISDGHRERAPVLPQALWTCGRDGRSADGIVGVAIGVCGGLLRIGSRTVRLAAQQSAGQFERL